MKKLGIFVLAILAVGALFFACVAINDFTRGDINFGVFSLRIALFTALARVTGIKAAKEAGYYDPED